MTATVGELGEAHVLRWIKGRLRRDHELLELGIGDDAAILKIPGRVVATVDAIAAGTDWIIKSTPRAAIGHRAAAVNLSDLAAMGATPAFLLVSLELPLDLPMADLQTSIEGLSALSDAHQIAVAGGDIGMGPGPERWSVTALGHLDGSALRRDLARPGDLLWLMGAVGAAAVGLAALRSEAPSPALAACVDAHLWPQPHVQDGIRLQNLGSRLAAIDVSDGLWLDATRLAEASDVSLRIDLPRPLWCDRNVAQACAKLDVDWRRACASGGDDYALLLAAPAELDLAEVLGPATSAPEAPQPICIGEVLEKTTRSDVELHVDGVRISGPHRGHLHGLE